MGVVLNSQDPHGKTASSPLKLLALIFACLIRSRKFEKLGELFLLCPPLSGMMPRAELAALGERP